MPIHQKIFSRTNRHLILQSLVTTVLLILLVRMKYTAVTILAMLNSMASAQSIFDPIIEAGEYSQLLAAVEATGNVATLEANAPVSKSLYMIMPGSNCWCKTEKITMSIKAWAQDDCIQASRNRKKIRLTMEWYDMRIIHQSFFLMALLLCR